MELSQNPCLCKTGNDRVLFPQRIDWASLSAYEFSARRKRRIQHYRIVRCEGCGLVRSDPVLSEDDLAVLYRGSRFLCPTESGYAAATYASLVARHLGTFPRPGEMRLLEIGCGNGSFLEAMQRQGLGVVKGVEPSVHAVENAPASVRPAIINDRFSPDLFPPESFDVVCAFHVLDHLRRPRDFIRDCFRIVVKGGMIILACHNVDAWLNRILGERSPVFDIEHIFLFDPATLRRLVESCGFVCRDEGRLRNTYPLSYWSRYAPLVGGWVERWPLWIRDVTLTLYAGNIYLCAQKQ